MPLSCPLVKFQHGMQVSSVEQGMAAIATLSTLAYYTTNS